jgi:hypothetical protein
MKLQMLGLLRAFGQGMGPNALPRKPVSDNPMLLEHLRRQREAGKFNPDWERRLR